MKRLLFTIAALAAPLLSASAQANLTFSGGNGNPLAITLSAPVEYMINTAPPFASPSFVFTGMGNVFAGLPSFTGSMNFSVNGAGAYALSQIGSGYTGGALVNADAFLFGFAFSQPLMIGDVVRLNVGTLTSTANFAAAAPTSRAYETFLADDPGAKRSTFGVSTTSVVPEPASFALMGAGLLALVGVRARRRS